MAMRIPLALRRPSLLLRGALLDRDRPDLDRLRSIRDPDRFVWAVLPHVARTFAPSILLLPARKARTAAVAYLYCRMLDTYEDSSPREEALAAMAGFAARMRNLSPPPHPGSWRTPRQQVDSLLIERCSTVDAVFVTLPPSDRRRVVELVETMAAGMISATRQFADQGGVLVDRDQVSRYCHIVIGEPALFTLLLLNGSSLTVEQRNDALASSELIQLANITRDVERDLERGIGYHPSLLPHLRRGDAPGAVREARYQLMAQALPHVSSFVRLAGQLATKRFSLARASAVVMLLQTNRHYRRCARQVGLAAWPGPDASRTILAQSALAALSRRWSQRVMRRVERDLLRAAAAM